MQAVYWRQAYLYIYIYLYTDTYLVYVNDHRATQDHSPRAIIHMEIVNTFPVTPEKDMT